MIRRIEYLAAVYFVLLHAVAIAGLLLPIERHWIAVAIGFYVIVHLCTIVALHRLLSHRAFRCPKWVEYVLVSVAMITAQGSPLQWVATHRRHHAHTDEEGDVHSPRRGFWYGHILWMVDKDSNDPNDYKKYCRDLVGDGYYHWLVRYRFVPQILTIFVFAWVLGWKALPFTFALPTVCWMHATYLVNSVCHWPKAGTRAFETGDLSRNVWWVAILAFGEGWHNNHHAFPRAACFGMTRAQLDPAYWFIRLLAAFGLAWDIQKPSENAMRRLAEDAEPL
jgi:fatty-acid desaturase